MRSYTDIVKRIEKIEEKKKGLLSELDNDLDEMERLFKMQLVTECDLRINDLNWVLDSENFKKEKNLKKQTHKQNQNVNHNKPTETPKQNHEV